MAYAPTKRRGIRRKSPSLVVLNITSMLDMFTILIIFLLKSYSAEGVILPIPADLHLPDSTTQAQPAPGLIIELSRDVIIVNGTTLPLDLEKVENSDSLIIPELYDYLSRRVKQYEEISSANPDMKFTGRMVLEGDREVRFRLLKKILYTSGQAGFINQSLAVFTRE